MLTQEEYTKNKFSYITELDDKDLIALYHEVSKEVEDTSKMPELGYYDLNIDNWTEHENKDWREELAFIEKLIKDRGIDESSIGANGGGKKIG